MLTPRSKWHWSWASPYKGRASSPAISQGKHHWSAQIIPQVSLCTRSSCTETPWEAGCCAVWNTHEGKSGSDVHGSVYSTQSCWSLKSLVVLEQKWKRSVGRSRQHMWYLQPRVSPTLVCLHSPKCYLRPDRREKLCHFFLCQPACLLNFGCEIPLMSLLWSETCPSSLELSHKARYQLTHTQSHCWLRHTETFCLVSILSKGLPSRMLWWKLSLELLNLNIVDRITYFSDIFTNAYMLIYHMYSSGSN
jgi:hypothetical protein